MVIKKIAKDRCGWNLLLFTLALIPASGSTGTGSQSLTATIGPVGSVAAPASASLITDSTTFQPFKGSLTLSYKARTSPVGGGAITLNVSSDFSPSGGPSAAAGTLSYTCGGATLGTACSGSQTASTTVQTPVLTLPASACTGGGGACSGQNPNSVNLSFTLTDSPAYATGSYSAKITFTISAT
ncbi:MAG: hypothetical protein ABSC93_15020 [Bryobacteraceae bacterium]